MGDNEQLGMFGVTDQRDTQVVSAHTRILADGTEVEVAEHVRWNRPPGSAPVGRRRRTVPSAPEGQLPLLLKRAD